MGRNFSLSDELDQYVVAHGPALDPVAADLVAATEALGPAATMMLSPELGAFLAMLVANARPMLAVEVGTFTGSSALAMARALPDGGRLVCCDENEEWTSVGRAHWERAGVADRIDLRIGPAIDTLRLLSADEPVGFAFIDADKTGYVDYYEELVPRMSANALIVADNVLWSGQVVDPADTTDDTEALRAFNDHVTADPRTESLLLAVGDGFHIARRRG